jgi:glycylpeptide N-tetradecanoyltransferase
MSADPKPPADSATKVPEKKEEAPQAASKNAKKKAEQKKGAEPAAGSAVVPAAAAPASGKQLASLLGIEEIGFRRGKKKEQKKEYPFWHNQPVPKIDEQLESAGNEPIEGPHEVRQAPLDLLGDFEWYECNVDDAEDIKSMYELLNLNYVEDDDNMFRFDYSIPFLQWALKPPGFRRDWHLGVRVKKTKKLVGLITAVPARIAIYDKAVDMVEINFLCVHKKLRKHRLAPVLIQEITRRVNLTNRWQAVYTAGVVVPKPITSATYWHRSLNPKKLIDVGFSHLGPRMTMQRTLKLYRLPEEPQIKGIRPARVEDLPRCYELLTAYLKRFSLACQFTPEEFKHCFTPVNNVIYVYVVEDPQTKQITDFFSFYALPSTIIGHPQHNTLRAAYSFYNVYTKTPLKDLLTDALILAKKLDFDVYNCLDIMENSEPLLKELKFGRGDGNLQYYLFNWKCPSMKPANIGLVLL